MATRPEEERLGAIQSEVYGFSLWILSYIVFSLYLLWAYLPTEALATIGMTYLPSQHWAVALPAYILVTITILIVATLGSNLMITAPLDSKDLLEDEWTVHLPTSKVLEQQQQPSPAFADIPMETVSKVIYC